jgi:hypothetical protein
VLDHVNRRDGFSMKKPFLSSARGASFHTKQALKRKRRSSSILLLPTLITLSDPT